MTVSLAKSYQLGAREPPAWAVEGPPDGRTWLPSSGAGLPCDTQKFLVNTAWVGGKLYHVPSMVT